MLAELELREPAISGNTTRARAAVSAAIASNRLGRTIRARYADSGPDASLPSRATACRAEGLSERAGSPPRRSRPGRIPRSSRRGSSRGFVLPELPAGAAHARRPSAIEKPASAGLSSRGGFARSIRPSNGSTTYRLSVPTVGSSASATQTASRVPVSSQRASQSVSGPSAIVVSDRSTAWSPVSGVATAPPDVSVSVLQRPTTNRPVTVRQPRSPSVGSSVPAQYTAAPSVGSTAGRQASPACGRATVVWPSVERTKAAGVFVRPSCRGLDGAADDHVAGPRAEDRAVIGRDRHGRRRRRRSRDRCRARASRPTDEP